MFCPKCGKPEQTAETYCRQCGTFLPDLSKPGKTPIKPEEHVKVNMVFSLMTMVACFTLAALLYSILAFRSDTHWLIYATAGLLTAMGFWHTQTFWRAILLRRHFKRQQRPEEIMLDSAPETGNLLEGADFENIVPASVTDRTTKHLSERKIKLSQPEH
ncbi:MAG: zinc ribbon domain-containing protein [Pyrinomonadaceae bacterium]